jgi:hypothetical protein
MKTIYSGTFEFRLPAASAKISSGNCGLDIVRYDNGIYCAMMTEDAHKKGISITGICDRIAAQVYKKFMNDMPPDRIIWLEHSSAGRSHKASVDLIQFQYNHKDGLFTNPQWKRFFESKKLSGPEFLKDYGYILKNLSGAVMVLAIEDKKGYYWRIWANPEGFFIMSSNPSVKLPQDILDVGGVTRALEENKNFFAKAVRVAQEFTAALVKGFLNKGL